MATKTLITRQLATPLGTMLAAADDAGLHVLEFLDLEDTNDRASQLMRLEQRTHAQFVAGDHPHLDRVESELAAYFAGGGEEFSVPLCLAGSVFQVAVWRRLLEIGFGATRSYRDIARALGKPQAVRAVGRANGDNMMAIVVPCHRVIGADGTLTGYGGGLWRKRWLLDHEGAIAA